MKLHNGIFRVGLFIGYFVLLLLIFRQDQKTLRYRTSINTQFIKQSDLIFISDRNDYYAYYNTLFNFLTSFQYNKDLLTNKLKTLEGPQEVADYILRTCKSSEVQDALNGYELSALNKEDKRLLTAFRIAQQRLYFTFDNLGNSDIHFIHSDTIFSQAFLNANVSHFNGINAKKNILIFDNKFAIMIKDFAKTQARLDSLNEQIALHHDTKQKLVKEAGSTDLYKLLRKKNIEVAVDYKKNVSYSEVRVLSYGEYKSLVIISDPIVRKNTEAEKYVYIYVFVASIVYVFCTLLVLRFIKKVRNNYFIWLREQNFP